MLCNAKVKSLASACFAIPARFCGIFVSPPAAVCAGPCLAVADFLRAVVDLLSVRRRPFFRAAAFCRRSRLGWRCAPCEAPSPRLFRGGRGRKRPPLHAKRRPIFWRRHPDLNRGVRALQALALPLGYSAKNKVRNWLERETRFELATFTLAR